MPAALWAAWKGLGIAGKIISIVIPIVILLGLIWGAYRKGDANGYERCQQEHAQMDLQHASQVIEQTSKQAELPAKVMDDLLKDQAEAAEARALAQKELDAYKHERELLKLERSATKELAHEPATIIPCESQADPLDDAFVSRWDTIGRLFLEAGSADIMPSSDRDSESATGVRDAPISSLAVLRARAADAAEYRALKDTYDGLREFTKGVYIFQRTWQESQDQHE